MFASTTGPVLTQATSDIVAYGVSVLPVFVTFMLGIAGVLFVKRMIKGGIKRI